MPRSSPSTKKVPLLLLGMGSVLFYFLWWQVATYRIPEASFQVGLDRTVIESEGELPIGAKLLGIRLPNQVFVETPTSVDWFLFLRTAQPEITYHALVETPEGRFSFAPFRLRPRRILPRAMYSWLSILGLFALATFLATRRPHVPGLPLLLLVVHFGLVMTHGLTNMESLLVQPVLFGFFLLIAHATGPAVLLLFLFYPKPLTTRIRLASLSATLPQILLLPFSLTVYLRLYFYPTPSHQATMQLFGDWILPATGAGYGLAAASVLAVRFRRSSPAEQRQLLWLPYGLAVFAVLGAVLALLKWNAGPYHWIFGGSDYFLPLYAVLAFTVGLSFVPIRALDVGRVVNRSIVYAVISALVALVYLTSAGLFGFLVTEVLGLSSAVSTTTATILATALFFPLRNIVQRNVDRIFFKHRYQYRQTVRDVSSQLTTTLELPAVLGTLLTRLLSDLEIHHGSAVLLEDHPPRLRLVRTAGRPHLPKASELIRLPASLLSTLRRSAPDGWCLTAQEILHLPGPTQERARTLLAALQAEVLVFLHFRDTMLGCLAFGPRTKGRIYTRAEIECLRAIAPTASLAVRNAKAYTAVQELNQRLAEQQEAILELQNRLRQENTYLRQAARRNTVPEKPVAASPAFQRVLIEAGRAAATDAPVLLLGETGTGKDVVARLIHEQSPRANRPLITLNCAAIPATLLESELFGHEKGAFTGAQSRKPGTFQLADGGTLFLDEIGDMPPELQAKLLRVLEDGLVTPIGATRPIRVDVRLIAATNRDLDELIRQGKFRRDLYYRLNVIPIRIPPLRQRPEDILPLAEFFLERTARRLGKTIDGLSDAARQRLLSYHWPGNVRELANVVERAVILATGRILDAEIQTPASVEPASNGLADRVGSLLEMPYHQAVRDFKRLLVSHALEAEGGNKSRAAQRLGLQRTYLHRLLNRLEV